MTALTRLDNGVSILSHSMPGRRSAALGIWIARGSRDDVPDEAGYAHMLEHLICRDIARFRGDINACTSRELIVLHETTTSDRLDALVSLLSNRLLRTVFGDPFQTKDLVREQCAILHEIAGKQGSLQALHDSILARIWPGHPLARPVAGDPDVIRRATTRALKTCQGRVLQGPNICVVAAGTVDHDALVEACRLLARLPSDAAPAPMRIPPAFVPFERHKVIATARSTLVWVMPVAPYGVADAQTILAEAIMAGGAGAGRLPHVLRETLGLVYGIDSQLERYSDCGLWWLQLDCAPEETGACRRAVDAVFHKQCNEAPDPDEIERARARLHARRIIEDDDPAAVMERLARDYIGFGRVRSLDERLAALANTDPYTVRAVITAAWQRHALFVTGPTAVDARQTNCA